MKVFLVYRREWVDIIVAKDAKEALELSWSDNVPFWVTIESAKELDLSKPSVERIY